MWMQWLHWAIISSFQAISVRILDFLAANVYNFLICVYVCVLLISVCLTRYHGTTYDTVWIKMIMPSNFHMWCISKFSKLPQTELLQNSSKCIVISYDWEWLHFHQMRKVWRIVYFPVTWRYYQRITSWQIYYSRCETDMCSQ